ncbi:MAG: hypothetical protein LKF96_03575 [Treponema sp.]|jgi:hypothetical protein|nr:hypothetical protein [Treponema sp.]
MKVTVKILACFIMFYLGAGSFAQKTLPMGYGTIKLGMSIDEVKKALSADPDFGYRGDRDVSLLPGENKVLIETDTAAVAPWSYLSRCWFQFHNEKLYIITVNLNSEKVDHYSVFTALCKKYGDPAELSPDRSVWQNSSVRMSLERPLSLKYIDENVFAALQKESLVDKATNEKTRDMFLEGL